VLKNAYYTASVKDFVAAPRDLILGELSRAHSFDLDGNQRDAWIVQIEHMQREFQTLETGTIFFEFAIPRMGKRADVVLLIGEMIVVIEFKVGAASFDRAAIDQVHDYALDLKNFHKGSHEAKILPVLIATRADDAPVTNIEWASDGVAKPVLHSGRGLLGWMRRFLHETSVSSTAPNNWAASGYLPTPTIVEAAQALYQHHSVEEIARSDAGAQNLNATSSCIAHIVEQARSHRRKAICFVTGVPGSGKTLAGLNVATQSAQRHNPEKAVFLSGNGPLVTVLREALARDQKRRTGCKKIDAEREVASFIQNIHHFRDDALRTSHAPPEKVVIFDEAQRAWNKDQTSKFMQTKRGQSGFEQSEPEFLISVMDRNDDWCVIICLVGGGQEINTGEAGLSEWLSALRGRFSGWKIHMSDRLTDPHYGLDDMVQSLRNDGGIDWKPELHLGVSMRSFRAESLSHFIGHMLDNEPELAASAYSEIKDRYPVAITRDLPKARTWLRAKSRGSERYGLIASSGAHRLRPEGLSLRSSIDPAHWFLNGPDDVRSAYYLEEVATEFDIQGLEIDWAGVCWDADFRYQDGKWSSYAFKGTRWQNVNADARKRYLKNAYRVILTRARQGMVIFVPHGDRDDPTRLPEFYDEIAGYLIDCGLDPID
jgi:hypothetical protein